MRIEPLSMQRQVKALLRRFAEEMAAAGYPLAWARDLARGVSAGRLPALIIKSNLRLLNNKIKII